MTDRELFEQIKVVVGHAAKHIVKGCVGWQKVRIELRFSAKPILNGVSLRNFGLEHHVTGDHDLDCQDATAEAYKEIQKRRRYKTKKQQKLADQVARPMRGPGRPKGSLNK